MKTVKEMVSFLRDTCIPKLYAPAKFLLRADCLLCAEDLSGPYDTCEITAPEVDLCIACLTTLKPNLRCCDRCALPLGEALLEHANDSGQNLCGACQTKTPPWHKAVASFLYEYPFDRLLIALKYKGRVDMSATLAGLMVKDLEMTYGFSEKPAARQKPDCLIPVPLHILREFQRGYNQAGLLTQELGRQLDIPVRPELLQRVQHTPKQANLSKAQRKKNLRQAFRITKHANLPGYVAIVDDVMTTGSTVAAVSRVLLQAGVRRVDVWCCARAE